jgi:type IV pilus assembly protein PilP
MKTQRRLTLLVLALLAAASASAQGKKEAAPARPAPAKPGPAGSAAAAKPAPPDDATVEGRQYVYDPAGRRDPFKSLLVRERSRESRPPGIAGLSVDEMELQGIWKTRSGWLAQVRGSDNKSYLLRKGDVLFDGEVLDVKANELDLRQNVNDPQSVKPFRDVVKRLNAPARPE